MGWSIAIALPVASAPDGTTDDGLPGKEGAFLACAFWLIDNLSYLGRVDEARERFEALLRFASPLGLFAEEVDPSQRRAAGQLSAGVHAHRPD